MNCERFVTIVDAWLDGELDPSTAADAERHAAACPGCAREADSIRELVDAAGRLPRSIEPTVDLFPAIRSRLVPRARRPAWLVAAAAAALVAAGLWIGLRPAGENALATAAPTALVAANFELEQASLELSAALPPSAVAPFDEGLAVVDGAITEVRAAIENAPDDPRARRALNQLYRMKLDLLWRASRQVASGA